MKDYDKREESLRRRSQRGLGSETEAQSVRRMLSERR